MKDVRIAYTHDLGFAPVDPEVRGRVGLSAENPFKGSVQAGGEMTL